MNQEQTKRIESCTIQDPILISCLINKLSNVWDSVHLDILKNFYMV